MEQAVTQLIKLLLQLLVLVIAGGAISWLYSRSQKNRKLRIGLLREFAGLQGRFVALRYSYNSFHIDWSGGLGKKNHPLNDEEARKQRWLHFEEACALLGEFNSIKPLLTTQFSDVNKGIGEIHKGYQQWRRRIGANQPILQETDGKNENGYVQIRDAYIKTIQEMRRQV